MTSPFILAKARPRLAQGAATGLALSPRSARAHRRAGEHRHAAPPAERGGREACLASRSPRARRARARATSSATALEAAPTRSSTAAVQDAARGEDPPRPDRRRARRGPQPARPARRDDRGPTPVRTFAAVGRASTGRAASTTRSETAEEHGLAPEGAERRLRRARPGDDHAWPTCRSGSRARS